MAASSVGALAVACLELLRAQAHLTMNASFEFETFRQDELFWMNTFLGGGNGFDSVFFWFCDVFWHNSMIFFKVAHEVD